MVNNKNRYLEFVDVDKQRTAQSVSGEPSVRSEMTEKTHLTNIADANVLIATLPDIQGRNRHPNAKRTDLQKAILKRDSVHFTRQTIVAACRYFLVALNKYAAKAQHNDYLSVGTRRDYNANTNLFDYSEQRQITTNRNAALLLTYYSIKSFINTMCFIGLRSRIKLAAFIRRFYLNITTLGQIGIGNNLKRSTFIGLRRKPAVILFPSFKFCKKISLNSEAKFGVSV